jgi:hypothetical protein
MYIKINKLVLYVIRWLDIILFMQTYDQILMPCPDSRQGWGVLA